MGDWAAEADDDNAQWGAATEQKTTTASFDWTITPIENDNSNRYEDNIEPREERNERFYERREDRFNDRREDRFNNRGYQRDENRPFRNRNDRPRGRNEYRDRHEKRFNRDRSPFMEPIAKPALDFSNDSEAAFEQLLKQPSIYQTQEPMTYTQWLKVIGMSVDPNLAAEKYDNFCQGYQEKRLKVFFDTFKKHPWFKDLYLMNQNQVKETIEKNYKKFSEDLPKLQSFDFTFDQSSSENDKNPLELNCLDVPLESEQFPVLIIKWIPLFLSKKEIETVFERDPSFKAVVLSAPNYQNKLIRVGWVILQPNSNPREFLGRNIDKKLKLQKLNGNDFDFDFPLDIWDPLKKVKVYYARGEDALRQHLMEAKELAHQLNELYQIPDLISNQISVQLQDLNQLKEIDQKQVKYYLDLHLIYLRRVFYYCFYCQRKFHSEQEIKHFCFHHFRSEQSSNYQEKRKSMQMPKEIEPQESFIDSFIQTHTVQIEQQKFKCAIEGCTKLFKAPEFVHKHIRNKHEQELKTVEGEYQLWSQYCLDPFRPSFDCLPATIFADEPEPTQNNTSKPKLTKIQPRVNIRRPNVLNNHGRTYLDLDPGFTGEEEISYG